MTLRRRTLLTAPLLLSMLNAADSNVPTPPIAKVIPKELTIHGDTRVDNYYWLRDKNNPEVIQYLEAENRYTTAKMAHTDKLQSKLYAEIVGRIQETDLSVPVREGGYYYYSRTEKGAQYPIYCRRKGSLEAAEEVLLDANQLAAGQKYFQLGAFRVSPDHHLLAFATDTNGSEEFVLQVKDLRTGTVLPDRVLNTSYSVEWANDNKTLFYTTLAPTKRTDKVWRHVLGQAADQKDALVFHEPDERFNVGLGKSRSKDFLFIDCGSSMTSDVRFLRADQPMAEFRVVEPRRQGVIYHLEAHGDTFFIWVNDTGKNFRLVSAQASNPSREHWIEVLPHRDDTTIENVDAFRNYLVVIEREKGLIEMRVRDFRTNKTHSISFPEPTYTAFPSGNPEYDTNLLRFTYTSLITPSSVFDYNMDTRDRVLKKQVPVLGGYDPKQYVSERIFATAGDGTRVPISLVYKKGFVKDGKAPAWLYAYGSYGSSSAATFDPQRLALLDRGFVWAVAHIRGGGDMGRTWYDPQGKLFNKKNTFTDFIACAEHLVAQKFTSADKLVIEGGSAGGLLMGAVVNMRPDLFRVAVMKVPFVDVITTELDDSLPGTVTEWEEWGNPNQPDFYKYMKSYSPYDNVKEQRYPAMLVTGGLNDPRVGFWEPAKWVAKMRVNKAVDHDVLLKTNMGAGDFGQSGRYERFKERAFDYAFALDQLGIRD